MITTVSCRKSPFNSEDIVVDVKGGISAGFVLEGLWGEEFGHMVCSDGTVIYIKKRDGKIIFSPSCLGDKFITIAHNKRKDVVFFAKGLEWIGVTHPFNFAFAK